MNAEQMRKLTQRGKRAKISQDQKVWNEAQRARKKMLIEARKRATKALPKVLKEIKEAARRGLEETAYYAGEDNVELRAEVDFIQQSLLDDGYHVKFGTDKHEPVGSDPERFDTYYTLHLDISWREVKDFG